MLPEFAKLWATAVDAGAPETSKRTAARLWLAAYAVVSAVAAAVWGAYNIAINTPRSGTVLSPAKVTANSESSAGQSSAQAVDLAAPLTTVCSEITRVASGYDLSDPSQHLAARAALEKVIARFPHSEQSVLASAERKHLDAQWISGNPSAALSQFIAALGCK